MSGTLGTWDLDINDRNKGFLRKAIGRLNPYGEVYGIPAVCRNRSYW